MSVSTIHRVYFPVPDELRELLAKNVLAREAWGRAVDVAFIAAFTHGAVGGGGMVHGDFAKEYDALKADTQIANAAQGVIDKFKEK